MISTQKKYIYSVLIFLLFGLILINCKALAQDTSWPPKEWKDSVHVRYSHGGKFINRNFYGKIVLKDSDTLKGIIRITGFGCMFLENGKFKSKFIPAKDVNYIFSDDVVSLGKRSYVLKKLHKHRDLFRLVGQNGKIAIYDSKPNDFKLDTFGAPMFLVIEGKPMIKLYDGLCLEKKDDLILAFINKHYYQSFQKEHFKTTMDMIEYILDKENEKEASGSNK